MTKQDEKFRLQRRLQNQAVELAVNNRWEEAVQINQKLISLAETTETYNRLGKAYFELGRLAEARDASATRCGSLRTTALRAETSSASKNCWRVRHPFPAG